MPFYSMSDVLKLYTDGSVLTAGEKAWVIRNDGRFRWLEALNLNTHTITPSALDKEPVPAGLVWIGRLSEDKKWIT